MKMNEFEVGLEESYEKDILADVILQYKELRRIVRKTGCEIHLGELKSKLNSLYFKRALSTAFMVGSYSINNEILKLKVDLINALQTVETSEEIQDRMFQLLDNYIQGNEGSNLQKELDEINALITANILQILKTLIKYKLERIENRISASKLHFINMKGVLGEYDRLYENFEKIRHGTNKEIQKENLEELYDEILDVLYEADLAIKDSKWLNNFLNLD